jgi:hypothetical protein
MEEEEWKLVKNKLSHENGIVNLTVDGYEITLTSIIEKNKLYIVVYVDKKIKGEWITEDCEIRRKFYYKSKYCPIKRIDNTRIKINKKYRQELIDKYTYYTYSPYFGSFRTLKSQLVNNNDSIELKNSKECI